MAATASTPANLVVGAGDVKVNGTDIGVTVDNNTFRIEEEIFEPDNLNGVPGVLVGTAYKTRGAGILATSIPEVDAATAALIWPGSSSSQDDGDTVLDWDGTRRLPSSAYNDWALEIPGLDGKLFTFEVDDGKHMGTLEYAGQDAGLMSPSVEIRSAWDPTTLTASPYRIRITPSGS